MAGVSLGAGLGYHVSILRRRTKTHLEVLRKYIYHCMKQHYPFHQLGDEEFEDLICHICFNILGTGTFVFAAGKDGGRDAIFEGVASKYPSEKSPLSGKFVVQAKWTSNPVASCSDSEFSRLVDGEKPKLIKLKASGELEHYLIFTNRKKPAGKGKSLEKDLKSTLSLKSAHILGLENLHLWMINFPGIWTNLGFDRFDRHLKFQTSDLIDVVTAFHQVIKAKTSPPASGFPYKPKIEKNKINNLSHAYYEFIKSNSLPYFAEIENFLKNPRNDEFRALYEDTAHEIKGKIITSSTRFSNFDEVLTSIAEYVTTNNATLRGKRRFVSIFLHYMYYTCDIGQSE